MTTETTTETRTFETRTCPRCGGTGRYSYCGTMNGKYGPYTCFKCLGAGAVRTKRGAKAYQIWLDSLKVRADSVKVGDLVKLCGSFVRVTFVGWEDESNWSSRAGTPETGYTYFFRVKGEDAGGGSYSEGYLGPEALVRKGYSVEEKQARYKAALDYQDCLTKTGSVRKARKAEAEGLASCLLSGHWPR